MTPCAIYKADRARRRKLYRERVTALYVELNDRLELLRDRNMPGRWEGKAVIDLWDEIEDRLIQVHKELGP